MQDKVMKTNSIIQEKRTFLRGLSIYILVVDEKKGGRI